MRLGAPPAALLPDLFRLMGRLGLLGRVLGVSWGRHGGLLGSSWGTLGCLRVPLGVSSGGHGACLGFCKDPGASPWVLWGPSMIMAAFLAPLGVLWVLPGLFGNVFGSAFWCGGLGAMGYIGYAKYPSDLFN